MFTIDLLKGEGVPIKTKPQGVAMFVTTFAVPVLVAILMVGYYVRNQVIISVQKQNAVSYAAQTERLADALKFKESCQKDKAAINTCLADTESSIKRYMQWSPILVSLVENLPDSVVLTSLEVKRNSIKRKVPVKGDPDKKIDVSVPVRTLKMRVSGNPNYDCDIEVKKFRDCLQASTVLGPLIEDVVVASQGNDTLDGRDVVAYDIDCIFKPGL